MDITPPGDDKGVRRLKLENEKGEVKQTSAVSPYPRIESSEERHEPKPPLSRERRQHQRRAGERRQHDGDTPFDTRSGEDRRREKRRAADRRLSEKAPEDSSSGTNTSPGHIDEKV